ncbi:MAG: hypothetical protein H0V80_00895 [Acidobacteria bacterium]|nr:hypothetical protein [Acidobacteriota bacterium]
MTFASSDATLVPGDTNNVSDVFLYDWATAQVSRVSIASGGGQGNGRSFGGDMTPDGRFVAFTSQATNLSPINNGLAEDVFVHDRQTAQTMIVSAAPGGRPSNGFSVIEYISDDGGYVVFSSAATNLTGQPDTNGQRDIFRHEVRTGSTTRVSVGSGGTQGAGESIAGVVSGDGRYVAFHSSASNLVPGDTNGLGDVFVHDAQSGETTRVNVSSTGAQARDFTGFLPLSISAGGRYVGFFSNDRTLAPGTRDVNTMFVRDRVAGQTIKVAEIAQGVLSGDGRFMVYGSNYDTRTPGAVTAVQDVYVATLGLPADAGPLGDDDEDGLPNRWETQFGLLSTTSTGADGAGGDPDGDGLTNLQEFQGGTHPRGIVTRYLAEGASSDFFATRLALANPGLTPASVLLRFQTPAGGAVTYVVTVPAQRRATIDPGAILGPGLQEFSTVIESDVLVAVDRTMRWTRAQGYGSHTERAVEAPATTWYFAEGATGSTAAFNLFYLVQNPGARSVTLNVRYLRGAPAAPLVRTYTIAPNSRFNIWVNQEGPELAQAEVSAVMTASAPVIVERAMYSNRAGQTFGAGHESAGVVAPAANWFLAEGATGSFFDLFVLIANPGDVPADVRATYLLPDGTTVVKSYLVAPQSRFNIWVDQEDARLADTAVGTAIASLNDVPIIVERAMWWPGGNWHGAHNSPGSTTTAARWALAEGEVGGPANTQTYILIANTTPTAGEVRVRLLFEDAPPIERIVTVPGSSRANIAVQTDFAEAAGRRFAAVVESVGTVPLALVVERAMYTDAGGVVWASGTNALATRLP